MFPSSPPDSKLKRACDRAVRELDDHSVASDEYGVILERLSKLHKMMEDNKPASVSPDTLVMAATNIVGLILIIKHEHFNVITSKALSFVIRPR
jgi:hypothetical protein